MNVQSSFVEIKPMSKRDNGQWTHSLKFGKPVYFGVDIGVNRMQLTLANVLLPLDDYGQYPTPKYSIKVLSKHHKYGVSITAKPSANLIRDYGEIITDYICELFVRRFFVAQSSDYAFENHPIKINSQYDKGVELEVEN